MLEMMQVSGFLVVPWCPLDLVDWTSMGVRLQMPLAGAILVAASCLPVGVQHMLDSKPTTALRGACACCCARLVWPAGHSSLMHYALHDHAVHTLYRLWGMPSLWCE
jgi:hypothetical protein